MPSVLVAASLLSAPFVYAQGTAYCAGDGSTGVTCPCGNDSTAGSGEGCAWDINNPLVGALLTATGTNSVSADDLTFVGTQLPPFSDAWVWMSTSAAGTPTLFSDGLQCLGTFAIKLRKTTTDASGAATWGPGLASTGGWSTGQTRFFQVFYRVPQASAWCGNPGFTNSTNAYTVTFTP